jgi:hypothetical protein
MPAKLRVAGVGGMAIMMVWLVLEIDAVGDGKAKKITPIAS